MAKRILAFLSIMGLVACGPEPLYDAYVSIPEKGWHQDSTIQFSVNIEDVDARYYVEVSVRNNADYPNRNLWFFRSIASEQGIEYQDTAQYFLADEYGAWTGKGLGALKTSNYPYRRNALHFAEKGMYTFTFTQAMRAERLEGIEDIGLRIYKQKPTSNGEENKGQ